MSAEFVRSILDYDPQTGIFRWRASASRPKKWNTRYAGTVAGSLVKGHLQIQIGKGRNFYAHRLAWLYVHGEWPPQEIDHENRVRSDNRIDNLRLADDASNAANKSMQRNNKSGATGVWFNTQRGKWEAAISFRGRRRFREFFDTMGEAVDARAVALVKIHGGFAAKGG